MYIYIVPVGFILINIIIPFFASCPWFEDIQNLALLKVQNNHNLTLLK